MSYPEKRDGELTGWYYGERDFRQKGGPRFRRRFESKKLADAYEAYIDTAGQEPPGMGEDGLISGRTFASVAQELKDNGGPDGVWSRGKDESVLQRLEYVCSRDEGKLPIERFNYAAAERLVAHLRALPGQKAGTKMSPATINRYLSAISSVLTYAEKKEYLTRAPVLPWQKVPKKRKHTYSETQSKAVVGWLEAQGFQTEAFLLQVFERTGLRASELLKVRAEQIEDEFINLDDPEEIKNELTHSVYVGAEWERKLRALVTSGAMPTYFQMYRRVRSAIKSCGYNIERPLHSMRRTAATRTVAAEHDIQVAQQLLGHRSSKTTEGYRDVHKEVLRERAKRLYPQRGETVEVPEVVPFPGVKIA